MNLYQVNLTSPSLLLYTRILPGQFETDAMEEEEQQHASLVILYEAMVQLTVEPGRFDSIARRLTEDLNMVLEGGLLKSLQAYTLPTLFHRLRSFGKNCRSDPGKWDH